MMMDWELTGEEALCQFTTRWTELGKGRMMGGGEARINRQGATVTQEEPIDFCTNTTPFYLLKILLKTMQQTVLT